MQSEKRWKVVGWDTFAREEYPDSTHATEAEAISAAKALFAEIQKDQPEGQSGGQAGIQDHVFIISPEGVRTQYLSDAVLPDASDAASIHN